MYFEGTANCKWRGTEWEGSLENWQPLPVTCWRLYIERIHHRTNDFWGIVYLALLWCCCCCYCCCLHHFGCGAHFYCTLTLWSCYDDTLWIWLSVAFSAPNPCCCCYYCLCLCLCLCCATCLYRTYILHRLYNVLCVTSFAAVLLISLALPIAQSPQATVDCLLILLPVCCGIPPFMTSYLWTWCTIRLCRERLLLQIFENTFSATSSR